MNKVHVKSSSRILSTGDFINLMEKLEKLPKPEEEKG